MAGSKRLIRRNKLRCSPAIAVADRQQFAKLIRRFHRHDWMVYVPTDCRSVENTARSTLRIPLSAFCVLTSNF
jgi:hypothetical protein